MSELYNSVQKYKKQKEEEAQQEAARKKFEEEQKRLKEQQEAARKRQLEEDNKTKGKNFISKIYNKELQLLNSSRTITMLIDLLNDISEYEWGHKPRRNLSFLDLYLKNEFSDYPFEYYNTYELNAPHNQGYDYPGSYFIFGINDTGANSIVLAARFAKDRVNYKIIPPTNTRLVNISKYTEISDPTLNNFTFEPKEPMQIILPINSKSWNSSSFSSYNETDVLNKDKEFMEQISQIISHPRFTVKDIKKKSLQTSSLDCSRDCSSPSGNDYCCM